MARYDKVPVSRDKTFNKPYITTSYIKNPERSLDDIYIWSRPGDRLDLLASEYYNDVEQWIVIAVANKLGKGSLAIPPSMQIRIPNPNKYKKF